MLPPAGAYRGVDAIFLPNGCDTASFRADDLPIPADVRLPRPIAGFVGHLNARTDLALLEAVVASGMSLVIIGPRDPTFEPDRLARPIELPNVNYLGPMPFEALPPYLAAMDVGLVPYGLSEFNRWSFPMKALEYLSAGLPVVSTSLSAMQWLDTPFIALADTPMEFASGHVRRIVTTDLGGSRRTACIRGGPQLGRTCRPTRQDREDAVRIAGGDAGYRLTSVPVSSQTLPDQTFPAPLVWNAATGPQKPPFG